MKKILRRAIIIFFACFSMLCSFSSCANVKGAGDNSDKASFVWWWQKEEYYECTLTFRVAPERSKDDIDDGSQYGVYGVYGRLVMDNMVKLLESQSFAEILMEEMSNVPSKTILDTATGEEKLSEQYVAMLNQVLDAVSFLYLEPDADNDAGSCIRVKVSVPVEEGKDFIDELLVQIRKEVPIYIEDNMPVPADYTGTKCEKITEEEIKMVKK